MKKNKTKVTQLYKPKIKKLYFEWVSNEKLAIKFWFTINTILKYVNSSATKTYIDSKWIRHRRCSICKIYRLENTYILNCNSYYKSECRICHNRICHNRYKIKENIGSTYNKDKFQKHYQAYKWKYNAIRKVKRYINKILQWKIYQ